MRRFVAIVAIGGALLAACGGDDSASESTTSAPKASETTAKATETTAKAAETTAKAASTTAAAAASTTAKAASTTAAAAASTTAAASTAAPVAVTLSEWKVEAAGPIKAGAVTFDVKNGGQFPHELVVYKGNFASLAKGAQGQVDEAALPAGTLVGRLERFDGGKTGQLKVNLAAGSYSLVCNLVGGGTSHAARGQVLDVTVA